jgi:hypothetical protein
LWLLTLQGFAQSGREAEAFAIFEAACLHDDGQFDKAQAYADARGMAVAPAAFRDALSSAGKGAAWLASEAPFLALHAGIDGGCGVVLKPADEAAFAAMIEGLDGVTLVSGDSFATSWSRWYRLKRGGRKGILLASLLAATETKSAYLRYVPASFVLAHDGAREFLLADPVRFDALRAGLVSQ